tara:strand:- start:377 stop:502 length:126 start_codon:yes stop_codon:yes gene_type:complete
LDKAKNSIKIINPNSASFNERGVFNAAFYYARVEKAKELLR